jgi:hypothetical protein
MLSRVRIGKPTDEDIEILRARNLAYIDLLDGDEDNIEDMVDKIAIPSDSGIPIKPTLLFTRNMNVKK